ncbi:nucleosome/chromatin assembly factor D, partial [Zea mays]
PNTAEGNQPNLHAPHFPREPYQSGRAFPSAPQSHPHPSPQQTLTARRHEGHLVQGHRRQAQEGRRRQARAHPLLRVFG